MKKTSIVLVITCIMLNTIEAQIDLPTVNTRTGQLNSSSNSKGIEVDFNGIRSFKELQRLNIPKAQITPKQLSAGSKKNWKVGPWKMTDGNLVISRVFGVYENKKFYMQSMGTTTIPRGLHGLSSGRIETTIFPISINFMVKADTEYKLKLKHEGPYKSNINILVSVDNVMYAVTMNRKREFIMVFSEEASKNVKIVFSGLVSSRREPLSDPLIVSEIQIDELTPN